MTKQLRMLITVVTAALGTYIGIRVAQHFGANQALLVVDGEASFIGFALLGAAVCKQASLLKALVLASCSIAVAAFAVPMFYVFVLFWSSNSEGVANVFAAIAFVVYMVCGLCTVGDIKHPREIFAVEQENQDKS